MDRRRAQTLMKRLVDMHPVWTLEDFFSGWFRGAPHEEIHRGNALELTAYGFFGSKWDALAPDLQHEVDWYITQLEDKFNYRFPEGYNEQLRYMGHLQEPLRVLHSPLTVLAGSETITLATHAVIRAMGFSHHKCKGFSYWVCKPRSASPLSGADGGALGTMQPPVAELRSLSSVLKTDTASSTSQHAERVVAGVQAAMGTWDFDTWHWAPTSGMPKDTAASSPSSKRSQNFDSRASGDDVRLYQSTAPLVFMHGVGLGVTPYLHFIWHLKRAFPMRPIVMLECRHISLSLCTRAVTPDTVMEAVVEMLRRNRWHKAAFVAHSYGTFILSCIAQQHRDLVESMVLIDAVCCWTIYHQLLRNFIYRPPHIHWGMGVHGVIDTARYLLSRNLVIAEAFGRKFAWHKVMLWPEEMADVTLLVLSAGDDLVPSELVQAHLESLKSNCQVICHPTAGHGGFLLDRGYMQQVLTSMKHVLSKGSLVAAKLPATSRL